MYVFKDLYWITAVLQASARVLKQIAFIFAVSIRQYYFDYH